MEKMSDILPARLPASHPVLLALLYGVVAIYPNIAVYLPEQTVG